MDIPPYAVIHGRVGILNYITEFVVDHIGADTYKDRVYDVLENANQEFSENILQDIWDRDYELFADTVDTKLQSWLDEQQQSADTSLTNSVRRLLTILGSSLPPSEAYAFESLYLYFLKKAGLDIDPLETLSPSGLESLAEELSQKGEETARNASNIQKGFCPQKTRRAKTRGPSPGAFLKPPNPCPPLETLFLRQTCFLEAPGRSLLSHLSRPKPAARDYFSLPALVDGPS